MSDIEGKEAEKPTACTSATLLVRHREGDGEAFSLLIERYQAQVYSYLMRSGIDGSRRDDLFQEVFLKLHAAAGQYEVERPFEPWFYTIVANTVRTFFRKEKVRDLELIVDNAADAPDLSLLPSDELTEARETSCWLEGRLSSLPPVQREVVVLCCIKSLSQQDVATILNIPLGTVKTLLFRGRAVLAKALARRQLQFRRETA